MSDIHTAVVSDYIYFSLLDMRVPRIGDVPGSCLNDAVIFLQNVIDKVIKTDTTKVCLCVHCESFRGKCTIK